MAYTLQGTKDCAVVSICNFTGKSYDEVLAAGEIITPNFRTAVRIRGTYHHEVTFILAHLTKRAWTETTPRRGQDKLNGILSWHKPGYAKGHMTACINGHVFDTNGKTWPIEEYRRVYNFCLRKVWK